MRHFAIIAGGLWVALVGTIAQAQSKPVVVVELYTSQGCSSCPPADDFMAELVSDPGVIALALHVDYWDYIGWKDDFAMAAFTERQKQYARSIGSRTIYTPQFIVGGVDRIEGVNPEALRSMIRMHQEIAADVTLVLQRDGERLVIRAASDAALGGPMTVNLVRYRPNETVTIERGENAGRTVTYHNIVTDLAQVGTWDGTAPLELETTVTGEGPIAVFLQQDGPGAVLAAARID